MARTKSFVSRSRELPRSLETQFSLVRDRYVIDVPRGRGHTTVADDFHLDPTAIFGRQAPLYVEIGSGRGEQITSFAASHPQLDFLAFEVWTPGVARLAVEAARQELDNVRVIEADAQQALPILLSPASTAEVWTFFPDPWRKSRHHKRRLVSRDFAVQVADILEDGGVWRLATDWENYAEQMLEVVNATAQFALADVDAGGVGTFSARFPGRVLTHFEQRSIAEGRPTWDLAAVRLPRLPVAP